MKLIDLHCDTIDRLMIDRENSSLYQNEFCVDIEKLKKGNSLAQTFALFLDLDERSNPYEYCNLMADKFYEEINKNKDFIELATNYEEILAADKNNKIAALLSIEEGAVLEGKIENLNHFYDRGVRMMTLTWNHPNEIGYPNKGDKNEFKGLTPFGKEVVEKMNELGMLVDVSHLSDAGFYDVASISKKPFLATHSNARYITNHKRNLTDDMIKVLANKGGITGINFCDAFIGNKSPYSNIEDMLKHIKHIRNIGGIDVLAMGTDFDGIDSKVEIEDISQMNKLVDILEREKFTYDEIEKIFYKNALRVIKDVL